MQAADLLELRDDLTRETKRLEQLVISLAALQPRLVNNSETVEAAAVLRKAWPTIRTVHLFGSVLDERFREHSDLDLLVDGLPANALLDAIALVEAAGPLPVDLKRREDFSVDLSERLLRQSQPL